MLVQVALASEGRSQQLLLLAVCERLKAHLGETGQSLIAAWQPPASSLGDLLGLQEPQTALFAEEVPRLQALQSVIFLAPRVRCV